MITINLKMSNINQLKRKLSKFPDVSSRHMADGINKAIIAIEKSAMPLTPKKTGKLRAQYSQDRIIATPATLVGAVRNTTPYALAVHDLYDKVGTPYRNPSTPGTVSGFLQVGVNNATREVNNIFGDTLMDITKELAE